MTVGVRKYAERTQEILDATQRLFEAGIIEKIKQREIMTKPKANVS